jgi:ABC-type glycerol-3-phosphate transport system permease component
VFTAVHEYFSTRKRARTLIKHLILHLILWVGVFVFIFPFLWMISSSLKPLYDLFEMPPRLIPRTFKWSNYADVFDRVDFVRLYTNSIIVAVATTIGQVTTSALAAYAFGRLRFPGRDKLFLLYLATMMVPFQVRMIPTFILLRSFRMLNSYGALFLPHVFTAFGTFLLRQFFITIPKDLEESALMDGAHYPRIFAQIILPLCRPALAALAIFTFLASWNEFIWPLIVVNDVRLMTIPLGIAFMQDSYTTEWNLMMAGVLMGTIPVILMFILGQKQMIRGITLSGLKG